MIDVSHDPRIELLKDMHVPTRDGGYVAVDILKPPGDGPFPVITSMGAYSKDLYWGDKYPMFPTIKMHPLMNWETPDPEYWVPRGYALVRIDCPGTGKSPGVADVFGPVEHEAYYDAIEWCGTQPWSNGKVGALGVSYLAILQWMVAALRPPHLTAIIPWEGLSDMYREWSYQGGIFANEHNDDWFNKQFKNFQFGAGALPEEELLANRVDLITEPRKHPLDDEWHQAHAARLEDITVPLLSAANWGSLHLHLRGNIEGYMRASSEHKWMLMYAGNHVEPAYSDWGVAAQTQFFDYWLKGEENGMLDVPRVRVGIRNGREIAWRDADDWPLPETDHQRWYLDAATGSLSPEAPTAEAEITYQAPTGQMAFSTAPATEQIVLTGPVSLTMWVASTSPDMDMFVCLRQYDDHGDEVTVEGPHGHGQEFPMAMGWLRASHRQTDSEKSTTGRPWHHHQQKQYLEPGVPVEVEVEIWPTSITLPSGHTLRVVVSAHDDYVQTAPWAAGLCHNDPVDRAAALFAGENTILTGPAHTAFLTVPVIPA